MGNACRTGRESRRRRGPRCRACETWPASCLTRGGTWTLKLCWWVPLYFTCVVAAILLSCVFSGGKHPSTPTVAPACGHVRFPVFLVLSQVVPTRDVSERSGTVYCRPPAPPPPRVPSQPRCPQRTVLNALEHPEVQPQKEDESDRRIAHDQGKGKGMGEAEDRRGGDKAAPAPAPSSASAHADGAKEQELFDAPPSPGAEEEAQQSERGRLAWDGRISSCGGSAAATVGGAPSGGAAGGGRGEGYGATVAPEATAPAAAAGATSSAGAAAAAAAAGREAAMPTSPPPSSRESSPGGGAPAPPPASPVLATKQRSASLTIGRCSSSGSSSSRSGSVDGGELEESKVSDARLGEGGTGGGGGRGGGRGDRGAEDVEVEDPDAEELGAEGDEDPEQMAAVTRHHLAVVVHAQVQYLSACVWVCA